MVTIDDPYFGCKTRYTRTYIYIYIYLSIYLFYIYSHMYCIYIYHIHSRSIISPLTPPVQPASALCYADYLGQEGLGQATAKCGRERVTWQFLMNSLG